MNSDERRPRRNTRGNTDSNSSIKNDRPAVRSSNDRPRASRDGSNNWGAPYRDSHDQEHQFSNDRGDEYQNFDQRPPKFKKFYGVNQCMALMRVRPERVVRAFISEEIASLYPNILRDCRARGTPCRVVDPEQLGKVSGTLHHEGFCLEAPDRDLIELRPLLKSVSKNSKSVIVLLEGVENPHNLGGIIRTAAFFGVDGVVVSSEVTTTLSGATCRVAEGGAESLPVVFLNPEDDPLLTIQKAGYIAYGTSPHAENELQRVAWSPKSLIVFGAEGDGLKDATLNEVDVTLRIPTLSTFPQEKQIKGLQRQKIESLNVSVAAGIVLATVCAQYS